MPAIEFRIPFDAIGMPSSGIAESIGRIFTAAAAPMDDLSSVSVSAEADDDTGATGHPLASGTMSLLLIADPETAAVPDLVLRNFVVPNLVEWATLNTGGDTHVVFGEASYSRR